MPTINRIRIVNIVYDGRVISDCLFDYYGGKSALMNLANGCGKTVMVESIFQPIIPGMDIGGWKITDYLTGDSKPSYVMIEWLLDGTKTPSYFMTGICLSKTIVQGDDDKKIKSLKYFTFVHDYNQGNEYDIANIPVSETHGGKKVFYTYNAFHENLKRYKRGHDKFDVFVKDKKQDYQNYLIKHHIYEYEWALLAKINQAESGNGLAALFQNCKTSDELFDKWILKTVNDINKDQRQSLIKETASLIKPMITSSKALAEKEIMEKAAEDLESFGNVFKEYTDELDRKEGKERYIAGALKHIKGCIKAEENKLADAAAAKKECREIERKIKHEELSEQYHVMKKLLDNSADELKKYASVLPELERKHTEAKHQWNCMRAAEYYGKIKAAQNKITAAKNTIAALENDETAVRKKRLGATIYHYYSAQAERLKAEQKRLRKETENNNDEKASLNDRLYELNDELSTLNTNIGRLQERCESFAEAEKKYEEQIGELPDRDLTGSLTTESVDKIAKRLASDITNAERVAKELCNKKSESEAKNKKNHLDLVQNLSDINKQLHEVHIFQSKYDMLEKAAAEIAEVLRRYDIADAHLFEREENLTAIREKYNDNESIRQNDIKERDRLQETLNKLTHGELHTSPDFAKLLTQNGIDFQTGETYLKKQEGDYFDKLLARNPLLPFCFIVDDRDYDKAMEISQDFGVDRVCPVICRKAFDAKLKTAGYSAELGVFKLYGIYNKDSLHPSTRESYISKLEHAISELDERIADDKNRLEKISSDMCCIEAFRYSDSDSKEIKASLKKAEEHLKELKYFRETLEANEKTLVAELADIHNKISENETTLKISRIKESKYREYLAAAEMDAKNRETLSKAKSEIEAVNKSIHDMQKRKEQLSEKINNAAVEMKTIQTDIETSDNQAADFAIYSDDAPIDGDIDSLEKEFYALSSRHESSIKEQERICSEAEKDKKENQKRLNDSFAELTSDDYDIPFDAYRLCELEKAERKAYEDFVECEINKQSEVKEHEKHNRALKEKERELSKNGFDSILALSQIIGKYTERRAANDKNRENAEKAEAMADESRNKYNTLANRLEKLIDDDLILDEDSIKPIDAKINADELRDDLNTSKNAVREKQKKLRKELDRIQGCYKGDAEWIAQLLSFIDVDSCNSYIACFKIYDQLLVQKKLLNDNIKVLSSQLEQIENDRKHIIIHMKKHAEFLYNQIKSITNHSTIKINGKSKRIMQISIPDELDGSHQDRVSNFVDDTLIKLRNSLETEEINDDDLLRRVNSFFSDRLLFNAVTGSNSVEIKVWKSLKDERNSRLEKWESRYSGGEHFLVYFVVYTALVSYARRRQTIDDNDDIRSVFMIDNPFGETSSVHLLDVFIEIANKFKLQAICFSDLKQDSITKNFDLIYQMSLREAAYSNKSYLTIDEILNNANAESDTQLDFVSMNSQLSFI